MLERAQLVRAVQKTDFAVGVRRVVEVHQHIYVGARLVRIKWVVLVHGEGVACLGRLDVHGRVMQLDVRPQKTA